MEDDVIGCCEGACDSVAMPCLNRKTLLEIIIIIIIIIHNIYTGWRLQLIYTRYKKTVINA